MGLHINMNHALESTLSSNSSVKGILCADSNGLCISAVGLLNPKNTGRFCAISRVASSLSPECPPPTILIETRDMDILVKDYDGMTIVLKCTPNDD